jgi:hypothetical protein
LEELKATLKEKEDFREKVKAELFAVTGQIQMLEDMIKKEESKTEETPK